MNGGSGRFFKAYFLLAWGATFSGLTIAGGLLGAMINFVWLTLAGAGVLSFTLWRLILGSLGGESLIEDFDQAPRDYKDIHGIAR